MSPGFPTQPSTAGISQTWLCPFPTPGRHREEHVHLRAHRGDCRAPGRGICQGEKIKQEARKPLVGGVSHLPPPQPLAPCTLPAPWPLPLMPGPVPSCPPPSPHIPSPPVPSLLPRQSLELLF